MSWPVGKVSELAEVISGYAFKSTWFGEGSSKVIRIGDLKNGRIDVENAACFDEKANPVKQQFKIREGDILMALSGATVGKIAVATVDTVGCYLNQRVAIVRSKSPESADYLKYVFSGSYLDKLLLSAGGAAQPNLSPKDLASMEIPLPPLEEQKRIAAILDKADSVRRKRQQAIDLADDFLRSVFLDMFGDPVINPKGWEVKKFGTVIDVLTDYHANGSYKTLNENVTLLDEPNYAYMVRTTDLEKKNYTDNVKYIDQHAYEHLSKTKVYGGELVINKIGSAGAVYLMPYLHRPVSLAMNQFMIRCNEHCLNEFVYYQLKTNAGARELEKRVQGAVTKTITKDAVRDIPIILPPIELQRQFIDVVEKINKLKTNTDNSSDLIRAKFNSISQKAFAGEL